MIGTRNKKAIKNLSSKTLKANKLRNIFAIAAIALTTLLFTSLFTIGMSMMQALEKSTMLQVGESAHGSFKYLTTEEFNKIKNHNLIKEIGYSVMVGIAENKELMTHQTEIRYAQNNTAAMMFSMPSVGRMPQKENELVTDTRVLDKLGVPHKIGEEIELDYSINGKKYADKFVLSGYFEKITSGTSSMVWVSDEFIKTRFANVDDKSVKEHMIETGSISGLIFAEVMFSNSLNVEGKLLKVLSDSGYTKADIPIGVNWAYSLSGFQLEIGTILQISGAALIIGLAGYFIIYNIFNISVTKDIKFYGILKTIGTTPKQIKAIVKRQALILSAIGITIGLILGYSLGVILVPYAAQSLTVADLVTTSFSPLIFIGASLFSLVTVFISSRKPAKIASKISPVEAMRYTDVSNEIKRKSKKSTNGAKIHKMALSNIFRNKKKSFIVMASLSLSIILLNSFYSIVNGFDMDKYLGNFMLSDFVIGDKAYFTQSVTFKGQDTLTEDIVKDINSLYGIKDIGRIYFKDDKHRLSDKSIEWFKSLVNLNSENPYANKESKEIMESGEINIHLNGLDKLIWNKFEIKKGKFDSEKFASGNYIVIGIPGDVYFNINEEIDKKMQNADRNHTASYYDVGENIEIDYGNGNKKTYEVMAITDMKFNLTVRRADGTDVFMPSEEFKKQVENPVIMTTIFDVKDEYIDNTEKYITNLIKTKEPMLSYESRDMYKKEFAKTQSTYEVVGYALSFVVAVIGILNFINSMATNILARRQEYAMLQSIGMTHQQLNKMLIFEGLYYAIFTIIIVVTLGTPMTYFIDQAIAGGMSIFTYHFTILPVLACIPFIIAISMIIPWIFYKTTRKMSIVERLREIA
jgi:putative ABC transport system permease protein